MVLQTQKKLGVTEPDFPEKDFLPQKLAKWAKNVVFFNLLKNFVINFYWICSIMKIYIICCVPAQIPYFGRFWFLRYGPKCSQPIRLQDFLINHISRRNRWNSQIFCMKKFLGGHGQKWVWPVWSQDSKICCISRMNWRNELFAWWCKFRKAKSCFNDFWLGLIKNGHDHLAHEILRSAEWVYGLSWFFACWLWCNNFWLDQHHNFYLRLLNARPL